MNIYNLPHEVELLLEEYYNCFDPETGEMTCTQEEIDIIQAKMDEMKNQSNEIMEWYLKDRVNRMARVDVLEKEGERIALQVKKEKKRIDQIENLLDRVFSRVYENKPILIGTFTVSYRKSDAVIVDNEDLIPKDYKTEVTETKIDKKALKEAIKWGAEVAGAHVENRTNLSIK